MPGLVLSLLVLLLQVSTVRADDLKSRIENALKVEADINERIRVPAEKCAELFNPVVSINGQIAAQETKLSELQRQSSESSEATNAGSVDQEIQTAQSELDTLKQTAAQQMETLKKELKRGALGDVRCSDWFPENQWGSLTKEAVDQRKATVLQAAQQATTENAKVHGLGSWFSQALEGLGYTIQLGGNIAGLAGIIAQMAQSGSEEGSTSAGGQGIGNLFNPGSTALDSLDPRHSDSDDRESKEHETGDERMDETAAGPQPINPESSTRTLSWANVTTNTQLTPIDLTGDTINVAAFMGETVCSATLPSARGLGEIDGILGGVMVKRVGGPQPLKGVVYRPDLKSAAIEGKGSTDVRDQSDKFL